MSNGLKKSSYKILVPWSGDSAWLGGVNYFKNLFYAVSQLHNPQIEIFIPPNNPDILFQYAKKQIPLKNTAAYFREKFSAILHGRHSAKHHISYRLNNKYYDAFSHCFEPCGHRCSISWIPDFQHIHLPEMFSEEEIAVREKNFKVVAEKSKLVILSSKDALKDYQNKYPKYADKGRVLNFVSYISPDIYTNTDSKVKQIYNKKFNLPDKFFYVPNQFWQHKNHITLFKAVYELKKQGTEVCVLCSGCTQDYRNSDYFETLKHFVYDNNLDNNIRFLGIIDLNEVYFLIRNCISVINPSLFEGWSTTVEEAKSIGKNIILSDLDVHREQNPPEAYFFERKNYKQLAAIMMNNWKIKTSSPDYILEKAAKKSMNSRMYEFAKQYRKIILEALES